jgi:hypothetical protein
MQDSLDRYARNALRDYVMVDPSFQNDVPEPMLAGKELPSFKFELEKSQGKVIGNENERGIL